MKLVYILAFLGLTNCSFGQSTAAIEKELISDFRRIQYWEEHQGIDKNDSLNLSNKAFERKLLHYTSSYPETIKFDFPVLRKESGLWISNSTDGNLRIYSWDTNTGGTMHYYRNIFQYRAGNKVMSKVVKDTAIESDVAYFALYSLESSGKTYHLGIRNAIFSTKDMYQGIKVFSIKNNQLNDSARLIKTNTSLTNKIGFEYDFFSVVSRKERPIILIKYEAKTKVLSIPVVTEKGAVTNKFIRYQFRNNYFERMR